MCGPGSPQLLTLRSAVRSHCIVVHSLTRFRTSGDEPDGWMSVGVCSVEVVMPCMIQMRNTQMVTDGITQSLTKLE